MQVTTRFSYLPFGGGRRKCIGDQFALFESVVALAMLLRRFTFTADPRAPPVGMTTGATIHTTSGLKLLLKPRAHVEGPPSSDIEIVSTETPPPACDAASMQPAEKASATAKV
jgi:beta-ring hydroxylase